MPQIANLKSFGRLDILRTIDAANLGELFSQYREYFEARGCPLPARGEEPDYRALSKVLLASDEETPPELIEALHVIGSVGVPERIDDLLEVASLNGVDAGDGGITPIDLALRIWLRAPKALQRLGRDDLFQKKLKFEHFPAANPEAPVQADVLDKDLAPLEAELDLWFQNHKRGPGCNIGRNIPGGEARFAVDHGLPCKRERERKGRESSALVYRPEKTDIVVYDLVSNELRVHASTVGEIRLYVSAFGKHLFGDEGRFQFSQKYTLDPLKERGRDALNCRGVDGLEWIKLREIQFDWGGAFKHIETDRGADLFLAFAVRGMAIPQEPVIRKAVFEVKLAGIDKPRLVSIKPPNTATFGRGEAVALIEQWLREQGFVLLGKRVEDEETDPVMAGF